MPRTKTSNLAPYAVSEDATAGRVHGEAGEDDGRPFARDRNRIIVCTAFRRLQYKTQVFAFDEHDHFRSRLTHTLEVAQIARRLAAALQVNEELAEAIALAHDLGHPPFGHAGEQALAERMAEHGGFEHNAQTLRVVDYLEHPYPPFRGLNLTFEVREGIIKHVSRYDRPDKSTDAPDVAPLMEVGPAPTLEAQLVSVADRIAYDCHDIEDALGADLITDRDLDDVALWRDAEGAVRDRHPTANIHAIRRPILDRLVSTLIADCVDATAARVAGLADVKAVRHMPSALVDFSDSLTTLVRKLEDFLRARFYKHDRLARTDARARDHVGRLFDAYLKHPRKLPDRFASRVDTQAPHQVICDYIAGMTDRFCRDASDRLDR